MVIIGAMSEDARLDEERSTARRAQILRLAYVDTSKILKKEIHKELLPLQQMYQHKMTPLFADAHNITFGVTNTTSQQTMTTLTQSFPDQIVKFALISDNGFRDYMRIYDPPKKVIYQDISLDQTDAKELVRTVSATLEKVRADDMLAYLVQQAHKLAASDIHLENLPDKVRIRFRVDGVLHPVAELTHEKYHVLISAIASAGNVSTAASEAQQGHIAEHVHMADGEDVDINLRLETVPAINGMDIVMRLFNMRQDMYVLDKLDLTPKERTIVEDIIKKPSGLVMAVGPTGSGKTTTLYSILNTLNSEQRKIITIEDPVEYQFDGITQISVTSKTTQETNFAEKLRAVLRLDPDIVMVGEIRDMDTAKTALQASLTGHLVLSTFHAGSASAALTRMIDIIGENPLFLSAIRLVMAQRLVRRLDDALKQPIQPDEATLNLLRKVVDTLPPGTEHPNLENIQLYKAGSSIDNPYGFKGQTALREQLLITSPIIDLLKNGRQVTADDIEAAAVTGGMLTMLQDGILKVINGITTLDEIYRVLG